MVEPRWGTAWRTAALLAALLGVSCAPLRDSEPSPAAPPGAPVESDDRFAVPPGAAEWRLDLAHSLVQIRVYRAGRLAHLGHNHLVAARHIEGRLHRFVDRWFADLAFPVDRLTVDEPALRQAAGADFAASLSPAAVAGTRANLLGPRVLDAARFPSVRVRAVMDAKAAAADLWLVVRGRTFAATIPVRLDERADRLVATGWLQLRHADLGLEPFSALGGALRVAETLEIEFRLSAYAD